jgi:acyl-CoA synthetase
VTSDEEAPVDPPSYGGPVARSMSTDPLHEAQFLANGWWQDTTLVRRVRAHAADTPEAIAYVWGDARISWIDYVSLVDTIARRIAGAGLERGERVLVFLPDGAAVHAAFLACEAAGMIAVGVGWRAGERELRHLVDRTGAAAAVTTTDTRLGSGPALVERLGLGVPVLIEDLDGRPTVGDGPIGDLVHDPVGPSEPWLLNSTSGTTGLPKCVVQTQNRWVYFHQLAMSFGRLDHDEVWMSVVPAPFGFGLWTSHVSPTIEGATCVVQPRFDAAAALDLIERERVSVLAAVSSQFVMMLDEIRDHDLSSLKVLFTGGEAISASRAAGFEDATGCTILNFYGSNETGLLSGTTVDDPRERRFTTGGRVVDDMEVRLYAADGERVVADRGRGRPACRGPALALGYWDDDDANAELFTDDGWMFMGDIVEIDEEGYLSVVGRTSDFIIRGGKNISAVAVEEEVATHPAVRLCAVVAVPDERLGERVAAFVELTGGTLDLDGLTAHLERRGVTREWWPEYLHVLASLPRSSGGKVAKSELRRLAVGGNARAG